MLITKNRHFFCNSKQWCSLFALLFVFCATFAFGRTEIQSVYAETVPQLVRYQGVLKEAGEPVADGQHDVVFRIYDSGTGGTVLWTGTHTVANGNPVSTVGGAFSVLLGSGNGNDLPDNLFTNPQTFLGVTVGSDTEMVPRQQTGAAPYALNAKKLDGVGLATTTFALGDLLYVNADGELDRLSVGSAGTLLGVDSGIPGWVSTTSLGLTASQWVTDGTSISYTAGNIGIGTTNPGSTLSVKGDIALINPADNSTNLLIAIDGTTVRFNTQAADKLSFNGIVSDLDGLNGYPALVAEINNGILAGYDDDNSRYSYADGDLIVTSSGNIGIGTDNPNHKLTLAGGSTIGVADQSAYMAPGGSLTITGGTGTAGGNAGGDLILKGGNSYTGASDVAGDVKIYGGINNFASPIYGGAIRLYTSDAERFSITNDGNVGIGISNPSALLDIQGQNPSESLLNIKGLTYSSGLLYVNDDGIVNIGDINGDLNNTSISVDDSNRSIFSNASKHVFLGGNVGIGTTTPGAMLAVTGSGLFGTRVTASEFVATSTIGTSTFAGRVGIGTTTPGAMLAVQGNAWVTGALRVGTTTGSPVIVGDISGNSRGTLSVDIQASRNTTTHVASGQNAVAVGSFNTAAGAYTTALGSFNTVLNNYSTGVGYSNNVTQAYSAAFGGGNSAAMSYTTAVGWGNNSADQFGTTIGYSNTAYSGSFAAGTQSVAQTNSVAIGYSAGADVSNGIAIGFNSDVLYANSIAIGANNNINQIESIAIGNNNVLPSTGNINYGVSDKNSIFGFANLIYTDSGQSSNYVAVHGNDNTVYGKTAVVMGSSNLIGSDDQASRVAIGSQNTVFGNNSVAIGSSNQLGSGATSNTLVGNNNNGGSNIETHIFGGSNTAANSYVNIIGHNNYVAGYGSQAFGASNTANATYSMAIGRSNSAQGAYSGSVGYNNTASGESSNAFGSGNTASNMFASAFGYANSATDSFASAFGYSNDATGQNSAALGFDTTASGINSVALGNRVLASASGTTAIGFNFTNSIADSLMIGPNRLAVATILSTGEFRAPFFTATSTTGTSTFAGRVGIGTTTPAAALQITRSNSGNEIEYLRFSSSNASSPGDELSTYWNSGNSLRLAKLSVLNEGSGNAGFRFAVRNADGTVPNRLILTGDGFLGVGSSTPLAPLHVTRVNTVAGSEVELMRHSLSGISFAGDRLSTTWYTQGSAHRLAVMSVVNEGSGRAGFRFGTTNDGAATTPDRFVITGDGNVGVGTTTPTARFAIMGSTAGAASATDLFAVASSTNARVFTVTSNGNVGIGIVRPRSALQVVQASSSEISYLVNTNTSSDADVLTLGVGAAVADANNLYLGFFDSSTQNSSGDRIGYISGNGSGGVSFTQTSDRRLKEEIVDSSMGLNDLLEIKVRDYNLKSVSGATVQGFIAQELYEVYPYAVVATDNGERDLLGNDVPWGVDYGRLTPLLVKSIQDQQMLIGDFANTDGRTILDMKDGLFVGDAFATVLARFDEGIDTVTNFVAVHVTAAYGTFGKLFADEVTTDKLCVRKADGSKVCFTGEELEEAIGGTTIGGGSETPVIDGESNQPVGGGDVPVETVPGEENPSVDGGDAPDTQSSDPVSTESDTESSSSVSSDAPASDSNETVNEVE
jgi:hypothetical protein